MDEQTITAIIVTHPNYPIVIFIHKYYSIPLLWFYYPPIETGQTDEQTAPKSYYYIFFFVFTIFVVVVVVFFFVGLFNIFLMSVCPSVCPVVK